MVGSSKKQFPFLLKIIFFDENYLKLLFSTQLRGISFPLKSLRWKGIVQAFLELLFIFLN